MIESIFWSYYEIVFFNFRKNGIKIIWDGIFNLFLMFFGEEKIVIINYICLV